MSVDDRYTRRAVLGLAGALWLPAAFAAAPSQVSSRRSLIDVHHHWDNRDLLRWWGQESSIDSWRADRALAAMDEAGVTSALLSITQPGVWKVTDPEGSVQLARSCNAAMARICQDHPDRFGFFATVALPTVAASVAEVAFSLDSLKADGIGLLSSYDGKYLGDPEFAPLFEELNRRRAVVYVHPTEPACCGNLLPDVPATGFEEPSDTTRTIESLLYRGAFARWTGVSFIFAHGGGSLPFLAERILSVAATRASADKAFLSSYNARAAFSRLYFDCASVANASAWAALTAFTTMDRILFGSDFPHREIRAGLGALRAMEQRFALSRAETLSVESLNAQKLFPSRAGTA